MSKHMRQNGGLETNRKPELIREVANLSSKITPDMSAEVKAGLIDRTSRLSVEALEGMVLDLTDRLHKK